MALTKTRKIVLAALAAVVLPVTAAGVIGFRPTTHPTEAASIGQVRSTGDLEAVLDKPGPITVETVAGADWEVDRSGLINLDHPKAKAAGLVDGPEPIQIFFHAIRHPERGLFLVDTGVERALGGDHAGAAIQGPVARFMHLEKMKVRTDTASWLATQPAPPAGVFLTHLHLDHVSGMPDVPAATPIYTGPGEASERGALNIAVQGITDRELAGKGALRELHFQADPSGTFDGVLDVFGDGSLWALLVPGHTAGSTAYLARTPSGPVLFTGDACHTAFGWENGVEPGSFSADRKQSAVSLGKLRDFVARHPSIDVRLGHQSLPKKGDKAAPVSG